MPPMDEDESQDGAKVASTVAPGLADKGKGSGARQLMQCKVRDAGPANCNNKVDLTGCRLAVF